MNEATQGNQCNIEMSSAESETFLYDHAARLAVSVQTVSVISAFNISASHRQSCGGATDFPAGNNDE